ncbi:DegT/DnrJ/EryC1/StrS family aminotransferase [Sideroxydans sp.]
MQNVIRLSKSCVGQEESTALAKVIEAGYLGMGKDVQAFEDELRAYLETPLEVICVNTGTAALHLALSGLDIGPGDEVLVPSITYVASFQAISAAGARAVACDVTPDRVFIDLADAKRRITPRTKAIMPVHYASDSQGMDEVYVFAHEFGLRVIEDAAHGFGCMRGGKRIGIEGDVICFSFDGIKNITSGEGGAVLTGDAELSKRIKDARLLGVEHDTEMRYKGSRSWTFDVHHQGFRYHMSNLMAAIGREQLKKIGRFGEHRKACVARYREGLKGAKGLVFLELDYANIVSHIFVVRIVDGRRDALMEKLRANKIECGIHYMPNHLLDYFATDHSLPIAEKLGGELLSLPLHAELSTADQDRVIAEVLGFLTDSQL